ncbi:MAG: hypothetical protein J6D29_02430 [Solobacterium sp.]|nr:hypothetical protein [Solobacterium sp.]
MTRNTHPDYFKYFLKILGYGIVPLFFFLPFLKSDILHTNYTGLLSEPSTAIWFYVFVIPAFGYLGFLLYRLLEIPNKKIYFILFLCCVILGIRIPYAASSTLSSLHLFFSYLSFSLFQAFMFFIFKTKTFPTFYVGALILAAMISLTFSSINGLAEAIFFASVSITLTKQFLTSSKTPLS